MDLKQSFSVLWHQRVVIAAVLFIGLMVFALVMSRSRSYTATASILAVTSSSQDAAVLDPRKDPTQSAISATDIPSLLASATLVSRVGKDLHLSAAQTQKLGSSIKAKAGLGSDVLPITVSDTDPKRVVAEANAVVRELQRYEQEIVTSRYDLLIADLRGQLSERRIALEAIDQRVDGLTGGDPYLNDTTGNAALGTRLVALETQRDQIQATMLGDTSASGLIARRPALTRDLAAQEIVKDDPVAQSLRAQYGKDLAQLNNQRAAFTDKYPGLEGLSNQVAREGSSVAGFQAQATQNPAKSAAYVSAQLEQNKAESTVAGDQAQLDAVKHQISLLRSHLDGSRDATVSLASLRRDRDAGAQAFSHVSDRLAEAEADRAQAASINTVVLLDPATTATPSLLSRPIVIGTAVGVVFLWFAITLAFIVNGVDSRLRTRTTIEELYGSPVFTSVG